MVFLSHEDVMSKQRDKLALLRHAFEAGLRAVMADEFMPKIIDDLGKRISGKQVHLLAFGKGARAMAQAYFANGGVAESALVIMPHGLPAGDNYGLPSHVKIMTAAHPVPDEKSEAAAKAALAFADRLGAHDVLVTLISGGGSSLMSCGLAGVSLADKKALNEALLASGMPIQEMNIIRKHVSAVKGGRLALAAYPACVHSFALSDVPGDAPDAIASGPTCGDDSTAEMARELIERYQITVPSSVAALLQDASLCETPFCDDDKLSSTSFTIVASAPIALEAAAEKVREAGYETIMLGDRFQDDASDLADIMCEKLASLPDGVALISGGEASVRVTNATGVGGRNAQFALEMVMRDMPDVCGISCDTDGIDGAKATAGALFYDGMKAQAEADGVDVTACYDNFDSHHFFEAMATDVITGATETNVNDLRILLKGDPVL